MEFHSQLYCSIDTFCGEKIKNLRNEKFCGKKDQKSRKKIGKNGGEIHKNPAKNTTSPQKH